MLEIGVSVNKAANNRDEMQKIAESGIKNIEISFADYNDLKNFDMKLAKELCDEFNINLWSFHLPFSPFEELDPSSLDKVESDFTFKVFTDIIEAAVKVGIDKFVVHPSSEPIKNENRAQRLDAAANFLSRLVDFADSFGAEIAVEDLPRTCLGNSIYDIEYLLSANDKLRVCFDTNHLLSDDNIEFIEKICKKILTIHVSDYDFVNERHWLCGEGDIDWQKLYNKLCETGYNGVWLYELNLNPSKTINRRILTYKDLYTNANEIFEGKKPTPIGKRIENLGFWGPI